MASTFDTFAPSPPVSPLRQPEDNLFSSLGLQSDDLGLGTGAGKNLFSLILNLLLMALERDLESECRCECPTGADPASDPFSAYRGPDDEGGLPSNMDVRGRSKAPQLGTYPSPEQESPDYGGIGEMPHDTGEPWDDQGLDELGTQEPGDSSDHGYRRADEGLAPDASALDSIRPTAMPAPTSVVEVNEPIVVKAGEVFDGGNRLFQAGPGLGDGSQSEGQKPVFILEDGATLRNVQLAGADGVHTYGDARIENVWWRDVGEDALTMKAEGDVVILGGGAYKADDKIFQINAGGSFRVFGFHADGFGKAIRTNGGKEFEIDIHVRESVFNNGEEAIVRTDAQGARVAMSGVQSSGVETQVLAPDAGNVVGATSVGYKPFTG